MAPFGYGKILDVDLLTGKIVEKDIEPQFAREYMCEWSETVEGVFGEALIGSLFSEALDPLLAS